MSNVVEDVKGLFKASSGGFPPFVFIGAVFIVFGAALLPIPGLAVIGTILLTAGLLIVLF